MRVRCVLFSLILHLVIIQVPFDIKKKPGVNQTTQKIIKIRLVEKLIVEAPEAGKEEKPKDSAFEGKRNQKVTKQKVAKKKKKKIKLSDLSLGIGGTTLPEKYNAEDLSYIDNIEEGDFTQLNTIENKYFGFYKRIRKNIDYNWNRDIVENLAKLHKRDMLVVACSVKILIKFNKFGYIMSMQVLQSSGSKTCDKTALEALAKSAPFINPPKGLVVSGVGYMKWMFIAE